MEQLSLLQKIYLYGETLSSEELNQIVLYLNSSIEAINTLIARNNSINEGHCEMRYKVSAQLPEAPESGTDGKSNGWSDTYTKPDTANGEITWMTLSFFNGEGVYGAWSTPVCITWGSVRGQAGPKGESGLRGSFKSRVFKRLNTRPDTPTGGTYDNPIPSEGGWTDGIPSGSAIIWSSVCTFYGNGLSSGWSVPAPESDSDTLDIEFSPYAIQPLPPTGDTPFSNHESEGWYDPSSNNFNIVGTMIWRAERKVSNGEYNGDWTITRIVGEKGDRGDAGLTGGHYEFRYNNFKPSEQASAPTKPSNGSNGTTGGWTTSQETLTETLIKEGYATWMTQCYQNEASTYGIWTDPIRITGANGYDGADGIDIEFVYTKNNTGATPPTPPTTVIDDWPRHTDEHGNVVDHVTIGDYVWYDNPQGVDENMMYEFVSLRTKVDDVWSAYSPPVIWSKWGEKGMDGDGYEYIYKRFTTPITWADANTDSSGSILGKNDNPANWAIENNKEYYGPTNYAWSDDPVGIDENYRYEYVSCRRCINELWGAYETPKLWSGVPGVFLSRVFTRTNDDISNVTPSGGTYTNPIPNNSVVGNKTYTWTDGIPNGLAIIWSSVCMFNWDGTNGGWSKPLKESDTATLDVEFSPEATQPAEPSSSNRHGCSPATNQKWFDPVLDSTADFTAMIWRAERKIANGEYVGDWTISRIKGEKGDPGDTGGNYEFRYANFKPTDQASAPTKPDPSNSGTISPWSATQSALTEELIKDGYKTWMTYCFKTAAGTYGTWSDPIRITGANGLDGEDGSDIEFLYARTKTSAAPTKPSKPSSGDGSYTYGGVTRTWNDEDWGVGKSTSVAATDGDTTWSDNPRGVSDEIKYEWIIVRTKPAGKNTSFEDFSPVVIWSKYGEKGMDGDGVQYIFKLFDTELNSTERSSTYKPTKEGVTLTHGEWIPSGWNDDPPTVSSEHPYCYCSTIKKTNGTWGDFETLSLWAKYAKDGSDSTVPGPDGKGITYIITRDNYTEEVWAREAVIGDTNNFSRKSSDLGSSCRPGDFFIVKGTATDGTNKFHQATFKCTSFTSDLIYGTCVSHIKDGDKGDPGQSITGKTGPMFYIAGIWDNTKTYTKNDYKCPVVFLTTNNKYYYLKNSSSIGQNPSSSDAWGEAENFAAVFTEVLFSNFAKLGSFIMNQDWMISQHGVEYDSSGNLTIVSGDNTTNYQNFKTSSPTENLSGETNFCPNLAIDAKTGRVYAQRMDVGGSSTFKGTVFANSGTFTGVVNATSGSFNGDVYANNFRAGDPLGFNITVGADSIDFNYGSNKQAWFSTKKLQMNSNGVIEDSGNDAPQGFYLYMISPKTGNVVTIDFESGKFVEVTNGAQVEVHSTTIPRITAGSSGTASVSNKIIYYKNQDTNGNTIPNKYFWNPECTDEITSTVGNNCYVATKLGYIVIAESVLGRSPYTLRAATMYLPAMYVALSGRIVGSGNPVMVVDYSANNTNLKFVIPNASTTYPLYNSSVYYADSGTTLADMNGALKIASGSGSVDTYIASRSVASTIPTASNNKISVFSTTGPSTPMTKVNYTV